MGPELWVGVAAVLISGGAIGAAGTLLAQWIIRKVDGSGPPRDALDAAGMDVLRSEVATIVRHVRNMDARLDFTEQLLGGALHPEQPPPRLSESDDAPQDAGEAADGES